MEEEFRRLMIKYGKEDYSKFVLNPSLNKVSQQIVGLANKYGLSTTDMIVMFESLAQTCFDSLINDLSKSEERKDLLYYSLYKREEINEKVLFRTQLTQLILDSISFLTKFDLGSNLNIGCSLKNRFEILKKTNFSCKYCGRKPPEVELELEHIIPKSKGGTDDMNNLVPACRDCNRGKGTIILKEEIEDAGKKE